MKQPTDNLQVYSLASSSPYTSFKKAMGKMMNPHIIVREL